MESDEYEVHHRMHVSLAEALAAEDSQKQWCFRKFGFKRDGRWLEAPYRDNVQAFEEKFDGFLMAGTPRARPPTEGFAWSNCRALRERLLNVAALGEDAPLVRSARNAYTGAWYVAAGHQQAGLAAFKAFGKEGSVGTYTFELIGFGNEDERESAEPILSRSIGQGMHGFDRIIRQPSTTGLVNVL